MNHSHKPSFSAATGLAALLGVGWLGLRVPPKPFNIRRHYAAPPPFIHLPSEWPAPVRRHYEMSVGHLFPLTQTAVIIGRAQCHMGVWMPMRFVANHLLGRNFLRTMEATWFNLPFMKGEDSYINGRATITINGKTEQGPTYDQAANLMTWAEALLFPATFTHTTAHWEALDASSARLFIPFGDTEDTAVISFDPITGFMRRFSALRHRGSETHKTLWEVDYTRWKSFGALRFPSQVEVTWADDGNPWFIAHIEWVLLDAPVPATLSPGV